jgi:hypothetical protein
MKRFMTPVVKVAVPVVPVNVAVPVGSAVLNTNPSAGTGGLIVMVIGASMDMTVQGGVRGRPVQSKSPAPPSVVKVNWIPFWVMVKVWSPGFTGRLASSGTFTLVTKAASLGKPSAVELSVISLA